MMNDHALKFSHILLNLENECILRCHITLRNQKMREVIFNLYVC